MTNPRDRRHGSRFCLSERASRITGRHIFVDAGYTHLDQALTLGQRCVPTTSEWTAIVSLIETALLCRLAIRSNGMGRRYCLALDLKDDPKLIAEYKRHQNLAKITRTNA